MVESPSSNTTKVYCTDARTLHLSKIIIRITYGSIQAKLSENKLCAFINCLENQNISYQVSLGFNKFEAIELPSIIV